MRAAEPLHHHHHPLRHRHLLHVGGAVLPIPNRAAALARMLLAHPDGMTRLDMLYAAAPGLALNATCHVSRLRKAGCPIESVPVVGTDAEGNSVLFVRYRLAGAIAITSGPWPIPEGAA